MRLAMAKLEPTMQVSSYPIDLWAAAIWDQSLYMPLMYKAWMRTRIQIAEKAKIEGKPVSEVQLGWQKVHGLAGAVTMSLHRAGWTSAVAHLARSRRIRGRCKGNVHEGYR